MSEAVVWILIVGAGYMWFPGPQFASEQACKAAAAQIYPASKEARPMAHGNGFCIQAKIIR